MNDNKYKNGQVLVITSGDYSDYSIIGLYSVVSDFNPKESLTLWAKEIGLNIVDFEDIDGHKMNVIRGALNIKPDFADWLVSNKYIKPFHYKELYVGDMFDAYIEMRN